MKTRATLFLVSLLISSCFGERKVGKLPVSEMDNIFVNVYQEDEFDFVTPLLYEIIDAENNVVLKKSILIGTEDHITDLKEFKAKSLDSILYLIWGNEDEIYAIFDLKTGKGYPNSTKNETMKSKLENGNSLVDRIKTIHPDITANWN